MKTVLFIFLSLLGFIEMAMADTLDYWHVYYNNVKLKEFNQNGNHDIILKLDNIQKGDSITVKYFKDTPCSDCLTYLTVEDEKHHIITTSKGKGTFNPISFALKDLISFSAASGKNYFEVYYFEGDVKRSSDKIVIFKLKLE